MKVTMKVVKQDVEFEGTPEEFPAAAHLFEKAAEAETRQAPGEPQDAEEAVDPKAALRRVFQRRPLTDHQIALFRALADGSFVTLGEIERRTGMERGQIGGVLSSLARRVQHTEEARQAGLTLSAEAVIEWKEEDGKETELRLQDNALEVLRELGII